MKNKKLTDSEIKKALECCSKKNCKQCPNLSEDIECSEKLINLTLDLITRQQAKIDEFMKETAVTTLLDDAVVYTPTLKKFADKLAEMQNNTVHRYEVKDGEIPDICEIKLRDSGIDVEEIL